MKLIYGTTNKAKIHFMKRIIEPLGIKMLSLDDVNAPKLSISECGNDPLENAKIKALSYYNELKIPVFSCDSGLYIDELDDARQPGINVRGLKDDMTDDDARKFYSAMAAEFGDKITARYQNAICLILDENRIFEHMGKDIASERFYIVSKPHPDLTKRKEGFPLDSLSVHIESGEYYYDMPGYGEKYSDVDNGFAAFFRRAFQL